MPDEKLLLLVLVDNKTKEELNQIACSAIDNNVCYSCCVGKQSELLHDIIDEVFLLRQIGVEKGHLPQQDVLMTTWHYELDEALWFAIFAADNSPEIINTIFCLDVAETPIKSELEGLIKKYLTEKG